MGKVYKVSSLDRRKFISLGGRGVSALALANVLPMPCMSCEGNEKYDDDFTIIVFPDTHADYMCSYENLEKNVNWIIENASKLNIKYVAHVGDVSDERATGGIWEGIKNCGQILKPIVDQGIPFSAAIGNHDYDIHNHSRPCDAFNQPEALGREFYGASTWFGGTFEEESEDAGEDPGGTINHYVKQKIGSIDYLFLCIELFPRDKVMKWFDDLVKNRFPNHRVMAFTHAFVHHSGRVRSRDDDAFYPYFSRDHGSPEYSNSPDEMWEKYCSTWRNLSLLANGHYVRGPWQNYSRLKNDEGEVVYGIFCNLQGWSIETNPRDFGKLYEGSGIYQASMIRILHIQPRYNNIQIKNYHPPLDLVLDPGEPGHHILQSC